MFAPLRRFERLGRDASAGVPTPALGGVAFGAEEAVRRWIHAAICLSAATSRSQANREFESLGEFEL